MGEAKRRGSREVRVAEGIAKRDALALERQIRLKRIAIRQKKREIESRHLRTKEHKQWYRERKRRYDHLILPIMLALGISHD